MDLIDLELLLDELGRRGVSTYIKYDHGRIGFSEDVWTVILAGREVGVDVRVDSKSLERCLHLISRRMEHEQGDWFWMAEIVDG